jgi:hypothetical protein
MTIADDEYRGVLRAAWNGTHLCFALTRDGSGPSGNPPSIRVRVDGTANGFLRGLDNLTLLFEPKAGGTFTVRQEAEGEAFVPGGRPVGAPWSDLENVAAAWTAAGDSAQVEIGLPKSPSLGMNLFLDEQTRFDVELRPAESSLWLRVFEPLALFRGVLTQPQPGGKTTD